MKNLRSTWIAGLALLGVVAAGPALAAETYYTDQGHTEVHFAWSHAGVSMQSGEFTKVTGKLVLDPDNPEKSTIKVTIDAASISTGFAQLDSDLSSKKWLDVKNFPTITFESSSVKKTGDKTADVTGNLTIHGVTKPVTLKVTMTHRGAHPVAKVIPYYKGNWTAFSATTKIDHKAFGVGPFSTGPISITISTEMKDREK